jgi:hypothetical protein
MRVVWLGGGRLEEDKVALRSLSSLTTILRASFLQKAATEDPSTHHAHQSRLTDTQTRSSTVTTTRISISLTSSNATAYATNYAPGSTTSLSLRLICFTRGSKPPPVYQLKIKPITIRISTTITTMSTSNNEALYQQDEVCFHYMKVELMHDDECICLLCAELDLDGICWHYLSGQCTHNDECAHFHPTELDSVLIPFLATPPNPPFPTPTSPVARHDQLTQIYWYFDMEEVTYVYERGSSITLPIPYAASYSSPEALASTNAEGQSSNPCAYKLEHCWAPHCARPKWTPDPWLPPAERPRVVGHLPPPAGELHSASVDVDADLDLDLDMVDHFAKTTLDSGAMEK